MDYDVTTILYHNSINNINDWIGVEVVFDVDSSKQIVHVEAVSPNIINSNPYNMENCFLGLPDGVLRFTISFDKVLNLDPDDTTGRIYIYNVDDDSLVTEVDYYNVSVENNISTVSFDVQCSDLLYDAYLYVIIDENAHIRQGDKIVSLVHKYNWSFTTAYGPKQDGVFKFNNTGDDFFDNYDTANNKFETKSNQYPIASSYLKERIIGLIGEKEYNYRTKKSKTFGGACYGMAVATALYHYGMLNPLDFDTHEADALFDLNLPKDSQWSYGTRDLINYYYLLQFMDPDMITGTDLTVAKIFTNENNPEYRQKIKEIVDRAFDANDGYPLVLTFGAETDKRILHAVMLVGARINENTGDYDIIIKDPNLSGTQLSTIKVSSDFSKMTYEDGGEQQIWVAHLVDVRNYGADVLIGNNTTLSANTIEPMSVDDSYDTISVLVSGDFVITNKEGETIEFTDYSVGGTMDIMDFDIMDSGIDQIVELSFQVPKSEEYIFTSSSTTSKCTVKSDGTFISATTENADSVLINKQSGLEITGNNIKYDATATTLDGNNMFSLVGKTSDEFRISLNSDGSADVTADSFEGTEFYSLYENKSFVFDTDGTDADIILTDTGGLTVDGARISSDTTFSLDIYEENGVAQLSIKNNTDAEQSACALVAEYDDAGALKKLYTEEFTLPAGGETFYEYADRGVTYRVYAWDSINGMIPLGQPAESSLYLELYEDGPTMIPVTPTPTASPTPTPSVSPTPTPVPADEPSPSPTPTAGIVISGVYGDNVYYTLYDNGTLVISGEGEMGQYASAKPWRNYISDITEIIIDDGVTYISMDAFNGCTEVKSVSISNSVTEIGPNAFYNCSSLTSVTIPSSVTDIGVGVFSGCDNLIDINVDSSNPAFSSEDGVLFNKEKTAIASYPAGRKGEYSIPSSVTRIYGRAFEYRDGLTSITIPEGVTSIGVSAFYGCTGLTNISIPGNVTSMSDYAFQDCSNLTTVEIQNGATVIGNAAFADCTLLTSISIPDSVTKIGTMAFENCSGLTEINIPGSVTSIGMLAFNKCTGLTGIVIPSGVENIEWEAFSGCSSLTSVMIPASVTRIGARAFAYCSALTDVYYEGSADELQNIMTESDNETITNANIHYEMGEIKLNDLIGDAPSVLDEYGELTAAVVDIQTNGQTAVYGENLIAAYHGKLLTQTDYASFINGYGELGITDVIDNLVFIVEPNTTVTASPAYQTEEDKESNTIVVIPGESGEATYKGL